jgi:hypothetical protein
LDRLVVTGLVWALLVATTAAFVVTEALKLDRPAVGQFRGDTVFSPTCSCPQQRARFSFRLRQAQTVDVVIVDENGEPVRVLASAARPGRGRVGFRWGGREDAGDIVRDGAYRVRVRLMEEDRTVTFGRPLVVDTQPPRLTLVDVEPRRIAPGGEGVSIRFDLSDRARVFLLVDRRRAARFGLFSSGSETVTWAGTSRRRLLPPGEYRIALRARDRAGNRSPRTRAVRVTVVSSGE